MNKKQIGQRIMKGIAIIATCVVLLLGCRPVYEVIFEKTGIVIPEDNLIEQLAEKLLCEQTGICEDFTPDE